MSQRAPVPRPAPVVPPPNARTLPAPPRPLLHVLPPPQPHVAGGLVFRQAWTCELATPYGWLRARLALHLGRLADLAAGQPGPYGVSGTVAIDGLTAGPAPVLQSRLHLDLVAADGLALDLALPSAQGGRVWLRAHLDGRQEPGEEGVRLELFQARQQLAVAEAACGLRPFLRALLG